MVTVAESTRCSGIFTKTSVELAFLLHARSARSGTACARRAQLSLACLTQGAIAMSMRILSALALSCAVFAASCVQGSVGAEPTPTTGEGGATQPAEPPDQADAASEPTGEAAQEWTRADCLASWQHNGNVCNSSPPNVRVACFAAVAAMLTACLAAAQG
jgi:hypothetical protein